MFHITGYESQFLFSLQAFRQNALPDAAFPYGARPIPCDCLNPARPYIHQPQGQRLMKGETLPKRFDLKKNGWRRLPLDAYRTPGLVHGHYYSELWDFMQVIFLIFGWYIEALATQMRLYIILYSSNWFVLVLEGSLLRDLTLYFL